ncbi:hypothetical protein KC358_g61 [Hortaea werneckii]|nr:hypothetical protein KC358_g61 [Hortaea werneckii]
MTFTLQLHSQCEPSNRSSSDGRPGLQEREGGVGLFRQPYACDGESRGTQEYAEEGAVGDRPVGSNFLGFFPLKCGVLAQRLMINLDLFHCITAFKKRHIGPTLAVRVEHQKVLDAILLFLRLKSARE